MKNHKDYNLFFARLYCVVVCFIMPLIGITQAEEITKASFITRIPFTLLDGGTILLKATVANSPDSLNFVLDTGCGGISLDSTTAERLQLDEIKTNKNIVGLGQKKKGSFILHQTLYLKNLAVDSLDFHINDYNFLSLAKGVKVDGIIGYSFLKRFIVKVDYDNQQIEVWKPGEIKYPKGGYALGLYLDNMPMFEANVRDKTAVKTKFFFDTGADVSFMISEKFVKDSSFLKTNKRAIAVPAEGIGGGCDMKFSTVAKLEVGPYTFKRVPSFIFDDKYNVTRYPTLGGIIGNDLLHRFNLIINYPYAEIYLTPNSYFNEPFDYVYTGFKIFTTNGQTFVDNIVKDSPAEKAGLQNGDVLLGVNNNFSNNVDQYKNEISASHASLKMSILRGSQLKTIVVSPQSIL